ncbi:MAG: hypothetical protein M2R45_02211 [Verrucomicrobia subdivision 3 bacterium]|nr:hypothetical protein [Limisphaerales bacterium]MCS1414003.1 hypothetical protein [Limisphaerales bacterium]
MDLIRLNSRALRFVASFVLLLGITAQHVSAAQALKVLLITGGCCHDYEGQKDILKKGLEARANVVVSQVHTPDKSTQPPLPILDDPNYADGFDVVVHDECGADISEEAKVRAVLKPHWDGTPGVNLHCAAHSYRIGNPRDPATPGTPHGLWFEYLGIQSSGHGPHEPVEIQFMNTTHPITKGFRGWRTSKEELYNNIKIFDSARPLASGKQKVRRRNGEERDDKAVVVWTNEYGPKKTKVFTTTLGHYSETVRDSRYLDLVTRGLLWATGHLTDDGKPVAGYGPGGR